MHALIVAGPSGAGKSTFLSEFCAGRLAADIRRQLPLGAETWSQIDCCNPVYWEPFWQDPNLVSRTAGVTAHYDITSQWWRLKQELARDPFWQVLRRCDGVTLVRILPPQRRLLDQWSQDRLGMRPWRVYVRKMLNRSASLLLTIIRCLRIPQHPGSPKRGRYPRPVRFLKRADRALRNYRRHSTGYFDFYRRGKNIEQMLQSWDEVVTAKTAGIPVTRIDLVPDPAVRIGKTFGWRMKTLQLVQARLAFAQELPKAG